MSDDTIGGFIIAFLFVGCVSVVCLTTIIHAVLEYRQKRWELERGIKTKPHDYHDGPI